MPQRRILIVDDELSIREILAEFLRDFGMAVTVSGKAEEALNLLTKSPFDVLIVDLRLPGITGDAMIPKAHMLQPDLRFLIHTGAIDYRLPGELLSLGLTHKHIIFKPLSDLNLLVDKIEALFEA